MKNTWKKFDSKKSPLEVISEYISSVENHKSVITIQGCSVKNQKGAIAVQSQLR